MEDTSPEDNSSVLRDLTAENELLRMLSKEQTEKLEALNQEVHTLKNRSEVLVKIQAEYQSEIECMQEQQSNSNASHEVVVVKLKEEYVQKIKELEYKIQCLENDLQEVKDKYRLAQEELKKARKELTDFQGEESIAALKAELQELLETQAANRTACVQHQELNAVLLKEKAHLLDELMNIKEHLELTEEKLKICKSDLSEQSEMLEGVRDSLALAQNELACSKANPSDSMGRGNSLFAEVEDKRQAVQQKISSLSSKYKEMKKDYSSKCSEISKLKMENMQLRRKWQEEEEERDKRDIWLGDNYEIRIKELTKFMEDLKKEEKPVFINGDSQILTYADQVVKESRDKMTKLREEMEWRSSERLNEAKALYTARCEMQTLKTQTMSLQAENLVLRDMLQTASVSGIPLPGNTCFIQACNQNEKLPINSGTTVSSNSCQSNSEEYPSKEIISLTAEDELKNKPVLCAGVDAISTPLDSRKSSEIECSTALSVDAELSESNTVESSLGCSVASSDHSGKSCVGISGSSPSITDQSDNNDVASRDSHKDNLFPNVKVPKNICVADEDLDIGTLSKLNHELEELHMKSLGNRFSFDGSPSLGNIAHFHSGSPSKSVQNSVSHPSDNDVFSSIASEMALGRSSDSPCDKHDMSEKEVDKITEVEGFSGLLDPIKIQKPLRLMRAELLEKQESCSIQAQNEQSEFFLDGTVSNDVLSTPSFKSINLLSSCELKTESNLSEGEQILNTIQDTEFVYPGVTKPARVIKAEMKENLQFLGDCCESGSDENGSISQESCTGSGDYIPKPQHELPPPSGRSILSKVSRPSLVPLDPNVKNRKVSFAISEVSETVTCKSDCKKESTCKEHPKKKLTRLPQPKMYKTRVIVSKENDD